MKNHYTPGSVVQDNHQANAVLRRSLWAGGLFIVAASVVAQLTFDAYLYRKSVFPGDQSYIVSLIADAVRASKKPAVVEPVSHKVYLPDVNLVLPAYPTAVPEIVYSYIPADGDTAAELQIANGKVVDLALSRLRAKAAGPSQDPSDVFAEVPNLQACSRGIHVYFDATAGSASKLTAVGTKQLKDGRTAYLYDEKICNADPTQLIAYVQQLESY